MDSTRQDPKRHGSPYIEQIFAGLPKVASVIVAIWDFIHTKDIQRFSILLGIGYATAIPKPNLTKLKALATKLLKSD